jgi:hypothetical protein
MSRDRRLGNRNLSPVRIAVVALGALAFGAAAGCHSSSHGVGGSGGGGGNPHGDASGDAVGSSAGGGGGTTASDGGADARSNGAGGGGGTTTGAGGGSSPPDAASDAFGAGCNTLTLGAPVNVTCAPDGGVPPTPTGGTIPPGTYVLTGFTDYGFCQTIQAAQTVVLTTNTVETVVDSPVTGFSRENATYTLSGTNLIQTQTCPAPSSPTTNTFGYSVTTAAGVTTLTLSSVGNGSGTVGVYTKQ